MAINNDKNVIRYDIKSIGELYTIDFKYFSKNDIKVKATSINDDSVLIDLVFGVDYEVSEPDQFSGGTVKELPNKNWENLYSKIAIYRQIPFTQESDYRNGLVIDADSIETSYDRNTVLAIQLKEMISRSITTPISETGYDLQLPVLSERKGKLLGFTDNGKALALIDGAGIPEIAKEVKKDSDIAVKAKDVAVSASLSAKRAFKINIGDGQNLIYTINHNLDTFDYIVAVWTNTGERRNVLFYGSKPDKNNLKLEFLEVPAIDSFTVVITCVENSYTGIVDWVSITNKPAIYPSNWVSVAGKPELYNKTEINSSQGAQDTKIKNNETKINTLENKTPQSYKTTDDVEFGTVVSGNLLGQGQTWKNVTSSRTSNVTYTNNTNRPIQISINVNNHYSTINKIAKLYINGNLVSDVSSVTALGIHSYSNFTYIIPVGDTYKVIATTITNWFELR